MGVFDKLKNVFFEEEYVEVEEPVKKPKKEKPTIAKKIDLPEMPKLNEEKSTREKEIEEEVVERVERKGITENSLRRSENNFKFPMTFEEDDFKVDSYKEEKSVEPVKKDENLNNTYSRYSGVYSGKQEDPKEQKRDYTASGLYEGGDYKKNQKVFRPTPIISPIYGILDKNYKKEEIVQKKEVRLTSATSKKVDLDSVREKAYGDLASDITASLLDEVEEKTTEKESNIQEAIYDLNDMEHPVVTNVTVGDAEEYFNDLGLEYNVDYKDNKKEKATGRRSEKNSEISAEESEDSLFDLIDSMYKDEEEE